MAELKLEEIQQVNKRTKSIVISISLQGQSEAEVRQRKRTDEARRSFETGIRTLFGDVLKGQTDEVSSSAQDLQKRIEASFDKNYSIHEEVMRKNKPEDFDETIHRIHAAKLTNDTTLAPTDA